VIYTREVNDYDAEDLSWKRSLPTGLPKAERHAVKVIYKDVNIETSIPSRGIYMIMAVGLEETHRNPPGNVLEAQARQTKYASGKEMFKVGDTDHYAARNVHLIEMCGKMEAHLHWIKSMGAEASC
jgi:hypothetical protein